MLHKKQGDILYSMSESSWAYYLLSLLCSPTSLPWPACTLAISASVTHTTCAPPEVSSDPVSGMHSRGLTGSEPSVAVMPDIGKSRGPVAHSTSVDASSLHVPDRLWVRDSRSKVDLRKGVTNAGAERGPESVYSSIFIFSGPGSAV